MATLFVKMEPRSTVYYYGAMMVIHYAAVQLAGGEMEEEFHTHQLKCQDHAEENNRIMWEKW